MKKYISLSLLLSFILFTGCNHKISDNKLSKPNVDYNLICLDGVVYWSGYKRLAPYINPKTLTFMRCKDYIKMQRKTK
jgi:hypothetical protein